MADSLLLCPFLRILHGLLVYLFLDLTSLTLPLVLQLLLQLLELFTLWIHTNEAFQQLDLIGPYLFILNRLSLVVFLVDGRLQDHWHLSEGVVIHNGVESTETQEASANVCVEIPTRIERRLAIVHCHEG